MTQLQYNISGYKKVKEYSIPIFKSIPKEFENSWIKITKLNLEKTKHVACFYFNDKYPSGTVIVSNKVDDSYPDIYVTFDKNNQAERLYINPLMRKKGYLHIVPLVLRKCFWEYLGIIVDGSTDRSYKADRAYNIAKEILNETPSLNNKIENLSANARYEIEPPRDPIYPNVWSNQRIGGYCDK